MVTDVRILLHGARGRMGQALCATFAELAGVHIVATADRDAQPVLDGVPALAATELAQAPTFDVAIDFSAAGAFGAIMGLCRARRAALVSGTTGLSKEQDAALDRAATDIPLIWTSNYSIGMAALQRAAAALAGQLDWDCEIVESHHRHKRDAPSGSALSLLQRIAAARQRPPEWVERIAAANAAEPRTPGSIGIASLRGGGVVGDHTVHFLGAGERLELTHRADDRAIFARGAWQAALRIAGKPPGRYSLAELLWT